MIGTRGAERPALFDKGIRSTNLMDKADISKWLGMSISWVNKEMTKGLPYIKIGRVVKFRVEDVEAWLKDRSFNV